MAKDSGMFEAHILKVLQLTQNSPDRGVKETIMLFVLPARKGPPLCVVLKMKPP